MKAVLMSIQPKWCELIASGKKTVEVRKTKPKLETPFKVYIYETQGRTETPFVDEEGHHIFKGRGQVIGEFVCYMIGKTSWIKSPDQPWWVDGYDEESCLTNRELYEYSKGDIFYEWHITDLVIYDEPMELGEFLIYCENCRKKFVGFPNCWKGCFVRGTEKPPRPPQSWCYCEEVTE